MFCHKVRRVTWLLQQINKWPSVFLKKGSVWIASMHWKNWWINHSNSIRSISGYIEVNENIHAKKGKPCPGNLHFSANFFWIPHWVTVNSTFVSCSMIIFDKFIIPFKMLELQLIQRSFSRKILLGRSIHYIYGTWHSMSVLLVFEIKILTDVSLAVESDMGSPWRVQLSLRLLRSFLSQYAAESS